MKRLRTLSVAILIALQSTTVYAYSPTDLEMVTEPVAAMKAIGHGNSAVTRAEFVSMIADQLFSEGAKNGCFMKIDPIPPTPFTLLFTDVRSDDAYAKQLCVAMHNGIIQGYSDGSFHPNQPINMAEAAKVLAKAFHLNTYEGARTWYMPYVDALERMHAMPSGIHSLAEYPTGEQLMEVIAAVAR